MTAPLLSQVAAMLMHIRPIRLDAADAHNPAKRLKHDLGLDQIDFMSLDLELEDRFGVALGDDELMALVTVGDVVAAIEQRISAGASFTPPGTAGAALRVAPAPADPLFLTESLPCKHFAGGNPA